MFWFHLGGIYRGGVCWIYGSDYLSYSHLSSLTYPSKILTYSIYISSCIPSHILLD
jgi:hypothetical protein